MPFSYRADDPDILDPDGPGKPLGLTIPAGTCFGFIHNITTDLTDDDGALVLWLAIAAGNGAIADYIGALNRSSENAADTSPGGNTVLAINGAFNRININLIYRATVDTPLAVYLLKADQTAPVAPVTGAGELIIPAFGFVP